VCNKCCSKKYQKFIFMGPNLTWSNSRKNVKQNFISTNITVHQNLNDGVHDKRQ